MPFSKFGQSSRTPHDQSFFSTAQGQCFGMATCFPHFVLIERDCFATVAASSFGPTMGSYWATLVQLTVNVGQEVSNICSALLVEQPNVIHYWHTHFLVLCFRDFQCAGQIFSPSYLKNRPDKLLDPESLCMLHMVMRSSLRNRKIAQ